MCSVCIHIHVNVYHDTHVEVKGQLLRNHISPTSGWVSAVRPARQKLHPLSCIAHPRVYFKQHLSFMLPGCLFDHRVQSP